MQKQRPTPDRSLTLLFVKKVNLNSEKKIKMERKVCTYNKFGFCKFKDTCRNQHIVQICEDLSCKEIKICQKRHPKVCKRFAAEKECRFGIDCSYKHKKSEKC